MSDSPTRPPRPDIEARIAGTTICHWLARAADQYGTAPALSTRTASDGWHNRTWSDVRQEALEMAAGFVALGLQQGETVAIMAANRPEHVIADLGAVHAGGVPTTVQLTLGPEQVASLARQCSTTFAVLEGGEELRCWQPVLDELPQLAKIVVIDADAVPLDDRFISWADVRLLGQAEMAVDPGELDDRWRGIDPDDPLALIYTAGPDGGPKLVALTHHDVLFEVEAAIAGAQLIERNVSISYLPYADVSERVLGIYAPVRLAGHAYLSADPAQPAGSLFRCDIDWGRALVS